MPQATQPHRVTWGRHHYVFRSLPFAAHRRVAAFAFGVYTFPVPRLLPTLLLLLTPLAHTQTCTVFYNANILTGRNLLTHPEHTHALAIREGKITAISPQAEALTNCTRIDLHGAQVLPGFNDAHTHMAAAGQQKLSVDLDQTPSLADMQARIKTYAATAQPGQWLLGAGWDHTKWPSRTLPTRQDLDAVTGSHPAVFYRTDGHIVIANTAALAAANITATTRAPQGSQIDLAPDGTPTGIVREAAAIALLYKVVPPPSQEIRQKALDLAIADALAHGVTSVQDFSEWPDWLLLETMEHRGTLNLRIAEWLPFDLPLEVLKQRRASHDPNDPLLHLTQLKAFMDGSLGSRTAALAEPYSDDPTNSGLPRYDQQKLNQLSAERAAAGFQLGFHAIGDEANTIALNAFAAAEQVATPSSIQKEAAGGAPGHAAPSRDLGPPPNATPDLRYRIEHAQVLLPEDFNRFAEEHVIASMQPSHLLTDMAWATARLGPDRARYAYAWRSMLDHHIPLAFGTDYPVESISPFRGLYSAVTRQNESGTQTFHPEQRLTMPEALLAYTQTSAYAEFRDQTKGLLLPGYLADFVVLDRDLLTTSPREILATRVLRTVVNGRTVYQSTPQPLATPPPAIPQTRTTPPDPD